ncbi:hypothetical protein LP420_06980 [Massilia sp. B-10]|nr:hypothetical protein LP420_06980 [Massilia sp. B-10]
MAKDLRVNWNWHLGDHLDGNLGTSYVKALAPFVNFHGRERNLRSERRQFADAGYLLHPSWRLRAGGVVALGASSTSSTPSRAWTASSR